MGYWLILKGIILGIVEGVTEFLPVSSTGHLIVFGHILNFTGDFAKSFEVMIQLGAILAIVVLYRGRIIGALKNFQAGGWGRKLFVNVVVAVIPSLLLAVLFSKVIKSFFDSVLIVGFALIVGAIILYLAENFMLRRKNSGSKALIKDQLEEIELKDSMVVGLFQCLALIPGMSRSGSTISGGLFRSMSARLAAEFSFFLAIPVMLGAFVFEAKDLVISSSIELITLVVGFVVSFVVAYLVVKLFVDFLGKHSLKGFVYYRLIVGLVIIALALTGIL